MLPLAPFLSMVGLIKEKNIICFEFEDGEIHETKKCVYVG
jgi:hypothetical protein